MAPIARFSVAALDCPDPMKLAVFYSAITGWAIESDDPGWVKLVARTGATIAFQRAPGHQPPVWPGDDAPQQAHLDFDVPDLDAAETEVLALGARKTEYQPGTDFRVYLDPAGHPFCLCLDEDLTLT